MDYGAVVTSDCLCRNREVIVLSIESQIRIWGIVVFPWCRRMISVDSRLASNRLKIIRKIVYVYQFEKTTIFIL